MSGWTGLDIPISSKIRGRIGVYKRFGLWWVAYPQDEHPIRCRTFASATRVADALRRR